MVWCGLSVLQASAHQIFDVFRALPVELVLVVCAVKATSEHNDSQHDQAYHAH